MPDHEDETATLPPGSPAPHLQRLLEMMKREQQDAARTAEQAAASDAASEADPNPTEASAAPAAPIPTYIPASTAGAGHYHGPPVGLSPSARTSGTSPLSHSSGVSGGVRAPSTEEFTRRLFREIAAQHEQQGRSLQQLHQRQIVSLKRELETHGLPVLGEVAHTTRPYGHGSTWSETPERRPHVDGRGAVHPGHGHGRSPQNLRPPMATPSRDPHSAAYVPAGPTQSGAEFHGQAAAGNVAWLHQQLKHTLHVAEQAESRARIAEAQFKEKEASLLALMSFQEEVQECLQKLADELRNEKAESQKIADENRELEEKITSLEDDVSRLSSEYSAKKQEELEEKNATLEDAIARLTNEFSSEKQQELKSELQEQRGRAKTFERKLIKAEEEAKRNAALLQTANKQTDNVLQKQDELLETIRVLEAKVGDLQGERGQLRDRIKELEKALDRMRWPAGTTPAYHYSNDPITHPLNSSPARSQQPRPTASTVDVDHHRFAQDQGSAVDVGASTDFSAARAHGGGFTAGFPRQHRAPHLNSGAVSSSVDSTGSMFSFPRAPHANEETDFNIFTGEPKRGGPVPYDRTRRNRLQPETRMAWVESDSPPHSTRSLPAKPQPPRAAAPRNPPERRVVPSPAAEAQGSFLRKRLDDITKERALLRADLKTGGYKDPDAQARAEDRIAELDDQIAEVEAALS
eukprot:m.32307 g.32307  ORF g.32307 m.32307 type:complete len:692 (+) comp7036_c1_seq1:7687-9762(+)